MAQLTTHQYFAASIGLMIAGVPQIEFLIPSTRSYFVPLKDWEPPQPTSYQGFRDSPVEQESFGHALPMIATEQLTTTTRNFVTHPSDADGGSGSCAGSSSRWASGWLLERGIAAWDIAVVVLLGRGKVHSLRQTLEMRVRSNSGYQWSHSRHLSHELSHSLSPEGIM